jgi:hypothetical protein
MIDAGDPDDAPASSNLHSVGENERFANAPQGRVIALFCPPRPGALVGRGVWRHRGGIVADTVTHHHMF